MKDTFLLITSFFLLATVQNNVALAQQNLSTSGMVSSSSSVEGQEANFAIDNDTLSYWESTAKDTEPWIAIRFPGATEITGFKIIFQEGAVPNESVHFQYLLNGDWRSHHLVKENQSDKIAVNFEKVLLTDRVRLIANDKQTLHIAELQVVGQQYVDDDAGEVKPLLVNQSGYNLGRPKRFTAPGVPDKTPFVILEKDSEQEVFSGLIKNEKGDFSEFDPTSTSEYLVVSGEKTSFPFRIGPYWLERVSYRPMLDFMMGARHYVGNVSEIRNLSFAWRDGDFFNWAMQSLVALYASNPSAFERMEITGRYQSNASFPEEYQGLWGVLEPFRENTPDIVQLMHWDADVKVSQKLDHEMQKAELAHFLYAWPFLSRWLPRQNFDRVYAYTQSVWTKGTVSPHANSQYDRSPEHNLLALKTQLGSTKGEMPPGFSVIPNLMMYEVGKREGDPDAGMYFDAAYRQLEWMITHLDWEDPMTTKGQRMSEHITMRAFAWFYQEYPDRHPEGLKEKVEEWARIMVERSDNLWDFRKYDEDEWTPPGWNETGNILGFPAAVFAANTILGKDHKEVPRLEEIAWAHFENAFGRNPTGRQFSFKGPEEVEGVDLGWYSRHKGGIGLLEELPFVFDGSPKNFHYPNQPEAGNLGWTEGWVQFNTAYNTSMAYLANYYTRLECRQSDSGVLIIRLEAPLNFHKDREEHGRVWLTNKAGKSIPVELKEASPFSLALEGRVKIQDSELSVGAHVLRLEENDQLKVSYGYGFFEKKVTVNGD
ncbi:discoidin domain-containing protein [Cyclobacterium jeungdonense]|uniref:Discoidin domain-containing protein n=1 Tax=Cyclobacterium jeungdonense TaxID=708087 RepID=A0ABT8C3N4_9BACT|nr:discoidin domain-containing protein [Cyclobacterium jeungdonense]MDN3686356.1 discoidin domain-containing protein [Cyclobacterium jeungdonense]